MRFLILCFICILPFFVRAQSNDEAFQYPEFPNGGETAFWRYLKDSLRYPESARKRGTEGVVKMRFIIEYDGAVSSVTVYQGVSPDLDGEATRLLSAMPRWKQGRLGRHSIRASYFVPVAFHLVGNDPVSKSK